MASTSIDRTALGLRRSLILAAGVAALPIWATARAAAAAPLVEVWKRPR